MKVIALDFDGVIVTGKPSYSEADPRCIVHLNEIIEATDAQIVVSSAWRIGQSVRELASLLAKWGVGAPVIGKTPSLARDLYAHPTEGRGREIDAWMKSRGQEVESFVILDDTSDMDPHMDRLVFTHWKYGLRKQDVSTAIELLTGGLSEEVA